MHLQNIIISIQYNTSIGLYLENKIGYRYEWLIDFLNQFSLETIEELSSLIEKMKLYNQTNTPDVLVDEKDFYVYEHNVLGNVLFIAGDSDGTQLIFCWKDSVFRIENIFCPNEGLEIDKKDLIFCLENWFFCLQYGHLPIKFTVKGCLG